MLTRTLTPVVRVHPALHVMINDLIQNADTSIANLQHYRRIYLFVCTEPGMQL